MARSKISSTIFNPVTGVPVVGANVQINLRNTSTAATIYNSESGGLAVANPIITTMGGVVSAWIDQGSYDFVVSGPSISTFTYPYEAVRGDSVTNLTDANIAAANKDGTATTPSLRTLGTGANQAMPGNTSLGGPPSGAAGGVLSGTYPNPGFQLSTANVWTAEQTAPDFKIAGITGTTTGRFVGFTGGGPPGMGTFQANDVVIDNTGLLWICVTGGTPGTWQFSTRAPTVEAVRVVGAGGQPAFQNGWVNLGAGSESVGFFKDPSGIVHLMGSAQSGTINTGIFQLPSTYRPTGIIYPNNIQINTDGTVIGPNTTKTCLDGISFMAGV